MPAVKVKENEPFDVALRRFKRSCEKPVFWLKFAAANFTRSRLLSVSVKQQLLLSVTRRKFSASSAAPFVCTNTQTFVARFAKPGLKPGRRQLLQVTCFIVKAADATATSVTSRQTWPNSQRCTSLLTSLPRLPTRTPLIFLKDDQPKAPLQCLLMSYPRPAIGQCRTQSVTFIDPIDSG